MLMQVQESKWGMACCNWSRDTCPDLFCFQTLLRITSQIPGSSKLIGVFLWCFTTRDTSSKYTFVSIEHWIHTLHEAFLHYFLACASTLGVMSVYPIDQYQNTIPRAMPLQELKEHFTLMTQDSFGYLKTLCMSVLLLSDGSKSE